MSVDALIMPLGRFRQSQDHHKEPTMYATSPEVNKGVNSVLHDDISYLVYLRDSQDGLGQSVENEKQVLRSEHPDGTDSCMRLKALFYALRRPW